MDFAKRQLEKYGWKEGQGLGKREDGIAVAIKPKLKFDNTGFGHDASKEFTDNWWNSIYQSALNNIEVNNETNDDMKMTLKSGESIDISAKGYLSDMRKQNKFEYGSFLNTSKLTQNGIVNYETHKMPEIREIPEMPIFDDDELFAACGGRTAHKAARHGLKLSGKLSRLEKQEKMLLKKLQNVTLCDEKSDIKRKIKKIAKHKEKHKCNKGDTFSILNFEDDSLSSSSSTSKKQKKKKKRKSVSFNETVTEYHTQDLDSSVHSSDSNEASVVLTIIEKSQIKDEETQTADPSVDVNTFDEGIEQDVEAGSSEECNHKSFEQAQTSAIEKLSKPERKLIKKNRATIRFLQEMSETNMAENYLELTARDECKKCIKRKQDEEYCGFTLGAKRYCEYTGYAWENRKKNKNKKKKNKEKARKHRKCEEKRINSIAKSLDKVCKISDNSQ